MRDSSSSIAVAGAVIVAYDAQHTIVGRNITDDAGRFRVVPTARATSVRVTRIGFTPTELALPAATGDIIVLEIRIKTIPTLLEGVRVTSDASLCPRRPDAARTAALLDQAKAGLLATVVAREANPATVTRLAYERTLDANGDRVVSQTVRMESADRATVSFNASRGGTDFAATGFTSDASGRKTFFGPDADVLLDDAFGAAYCFRIAEPDKAHPRLVGLGFTPATRKDNRVDISGTLWVDSVARRLSHIEFRYLGLDQISEAFESGGRVEFREVSTGVVLIDRWSLRLVGGTQAPPAVAGATPARAFNINEIGGELATASWPDGRKWAAPLGTVRIRARDRAGNVAAGAPIGLIGTDYAVTTDSAGTAAIPLLAPGPYAVTVLDPRLATIGMTIPTSTAFTAVRDSVIAAEVQVATAEEFVSDLCRSTGKVATESAWLIGRVGTGNGVPVSDAKWAISRSDAAGWVPITEGGSTGTLGIFTFCRNLPRGQTFQVRVWRQGESPTAVVRQLNDALTVLPVKMASFVAKGRGGRASDLAGTVTDSSTGAGVSGAFVELVGTRMSAITDSAGHFSVANMPAGEYTAEIRTTALDSLGAVGRSTFDFTGSAPVKLFVPTTKELATAMCGPAGESGAVVLGTAGLPGAPQPKGLRLVAEWTEPAAPGSTVGGRLSWVRGRVDSDGAYRLCGVPIGTAVTLRTQVDSGIDAAARPMPLRLDAGQRFARADITLEVGLSLGAAFSGVVVSDSSDDPIANAEVVVVDLKRTVATSANGSFRINDIPAGTHQVIIRRPGYAPITADVSFASNQTVDHRIALGRPPAPSLKAVEITATNANVPRTFEDHRKLGLGFFLTQEQLEATSAQRMQDVIATHPSANVNISTNGGYAWVVGKRQVPHIIGRSSGGYDASGAVMSCGATGPSQKKPGTDPPCQGGGSFEMLREQGMYCPEAGEGQKGIICACYAQVWVDGHLMNNQKPTEPFDLNTVAPRDLAGIEWYGGPGQTPAEYSSLNANCGTMVLWTRRGGGLH